MRIQKLHIKKINKTQQLSWNRFCYLLDGSYINKKLSSLTPESVSQGKVCLMLLYLYKERSRTKTSVKQKGQGCIPVLTYSTINTAYNFIFPLKLHVYFKQLHLYKYFIELKWKEQCQQNTKKTYGCFFNERVSIAGNFENPFIGQKEKIK